MIHASTLKFLSGLQKNNNKPWFESHREEYEAAKENIGQTAAVLLKNLSGEDAGFANIGPKDCMFRINRDVRFSADKSPYKTNMAAYFNGHGKKSELPGFYLHIEPGKCFAAAGIWMPEAKKLAAVRQEIDYNFDEWSKMIGDAKFKKHFATGLSMNESLQRPPKGYDESNKAIRFIKMKSFVVSKAISDAEATASDFEKKVFEIFRAAFPFNKFLHRAME